MKTLITTATKISKKMQTLYLNGPKDGKIRIFEPRKSPQPISEGGEIVPKKGARIAWVLNGHYLIVTGFSKYV